jgi:hypothetical protein
MHSKPGSLPVFVVAGGVLWVVVTIAAAVSVIQAPGDNVGLAIGLILMWVVLVAFAVMSQVTEWIGRR